jgi:hypothetical protein
MVIHKWEPDIYVYWIVTGPSFATHIYCTPNSLRPNLSPLTGVKARYEVWLKLTQTWGFPCSVKCLIYKVSFHPFPSLPFSY